MTQVRQREAQRIFEAAVARYQMYPDYLKVSTGWLDQVPANWYVIKLKYIADMQGGGTPSKNEPDFWNGDIPWVSPKDMKAEWIDDAEDKITELGLKESATSLIPPQSVLIVVRSGILKHSLPVAINTIPVALNQDMKALHPSTSVIPEFLAWMLRGASADILALCHHLGATVDSLRTDFLNNMLFPVPPPEEQRAITTFLDRQTAKIDALIAKKRELIAALHEQRSAIISHTVTKGLHPDAPMKDSGIEWLGAIPSHWEIIRSKRLFSVRNERAWADDQQLSATQAYGVIPQEEFEERVGRQVVKINKNLEQRSHVEKDDFVISMRSFQGGLERAWVQGCIRSSYVVLKPSSSVDIDFFMYLFKSTSYIQALQATADFIRDGQDLTFRNFSLVDLPIIPIDEQRAMAEYLSKTTHEIDQLIEKTSETIDRLQEYRAALISAAVTGKIDVRGA